MACMMRMDAMLKGLARENVELRREVKEMQMENMEDRWEYFREVERVGKDVRVIENWVRRIVE